MTTGATYALGQRIGALRAQRGWTQADLAARLAVSRVAVSHFEMGLAVPSERTVVLLAGLFKLEPYELVEGTSYPPAKRERLPLVAARYTEVEHQLALLRRDLEWLERLPSGPQSQGLIAAILDHGTAQLAVLREQTHDPAERALLRAADAVLLAARCRHAGLPRPRPVPARR